MARNPKQNENLKPQNTRTKEEQREIARMGGIASGVARRAKRSMYDSLQTLLSMPLDDGLMVELESLKGLKDAKGKNLSVQDAVVLAQITRALKGDVKSANFIKDMEEAAQLKDSAVGVQIIDDY